jgi:3-oxoacyl-[acyl-carrier protein] reductase
MHWYSDPTLTPAFSATRVLAKELGGRKVTVNAVAPGPVATELFLTGKSDER